MSVCLCVRSSPEVPKQRRWHSQYVQQMKILVLCVLWENSSETWLIDVCVTFDVTREIKTRLSHTQLSIYVFLEQNRPHTYYGTTHNCDINLRIFYGFPNDVWLSLVFISRVTSNVTQTSMSQVSLEMQMQEGWLQPPTPNENFS